MVVGGMGSLAGAYLAALLIGVVKALCVGLGTVCLLYTSDAADERSSVDLGGRRIIKQKDDDLSRRTPT